MRLLSTPPRSPEAPSRLRRGRGPGVRGVAVRTLRAVVLAILAVMAPRGHAETGPWTDLDLVGIDGQTFASDSLAGKVVLVVNVASFCGYTEQYADLQVLWNRYRDRGLVVLGVPCNQFGGQEPGSDKEIRNFCKSRYGVDFPLLAKQDVNGDDRSPLFRWLLSQPAAGGGDVGWNFEKFVVNRKGDLVARFGSHVVPQDAGLVRTLEMALDGVL